MPSGGASNDQEAGERESRKDPVSEWHDARRHPLPGMDTVFETQGIGTERTSQGKFKVYMLLVQVL